MTISNLVAGAARHWLPSGRAGEGRGPLADLPPKPTNTRYEMLDAWRGAACLMLLVYHATFYAEQTFQISNPATWSLAALPLNLIRKCWVGVPIFFVISGYCIAASIDSLRRKPHSLWDYFVRRVRRIYPPLWTMCLLTVAFSLGLRVLPQIYSHCEQLPKLETFSIWNWLGNFGAAEAWRHQVVGGEPSYLMANTWTLCYEEQFYVVTGLLLFLAARRFFAAAALTTGLVVSVRHALPLLGMESRGFFWDGHWMMFATGILVYHAICYQSPTRRWQSYLAFATIAMYGLTSRFVFRDPVQKHISEYILVAGLFGLALLPLRNWDQRISRSIWLRPLQWCGKRSYSIYLTHFPLVVVGSSALALVGFTSELAVATIVVPLSVAISLPIAAVFHSLVEKRFLNSPT